MNIEQIKRKEIEYRKEIAPAIKMADCERDSRTSKLFIYKDFTLRKLAELELRIEALEGETIPVANKSDNKQVSVRDWVQLDSTSLTSRDYNAVMRLSERNKGLLLSEITQKDFLNLKGVGIKTWNAFERERDYYLKLQQIKP